MTYTKHPPILWNIISLDREDDSRDCDGICIGFENGVWRHREFASNVIDWLPEFALPFSEYSKISGNNMVESLIKSSKLIYESEKYMQRGEFGEIFLHMAMRSVYKTKPLISKIFWKSSLNDTVKGFDGVHIVQIEDNGMELWLGEAKFYKDIKKAINDVIAEVKIHIEGNYLRNEFILISNKIEEEFPQSAEIKKLISHRTTLDKIFKCLCIPVFLTFESKIFDSYHSETEAYLAALTEEIRKAKYDFINLAKGINIKIPIFIFPMKSKQILIETIHGKIKALQGI